MACEGRGTPRDPELAAGEPSSRSKLRENRGGSKLPHSGSATIPIFRLQAQADKRLSSEFRQGFQRRGERLHRHEGGLEVVPLAEPADATHAAPDGGGDAFAAEPGVVPHGETVAPPHHPLIDQGVEPDRQQEEVLDRAQEQVLHLRPGAAQPVGVQRVAGHAEADQAQEPQEAHDRVAREDPGGPEGRQVHQRFEQEDRQRQPAPDLEPAGVAVQEPAEAPGLVDVLDDVVAQPDRVARLADLHADDLVLGEQVPHPGEPADGGQHLRGHEHRLAHHAGDPQLRGGGEVPGDEPVDLEIFQRGREVLLVDAGEEVRDQPDAGVGEVAGRLAEIVRPDADVRVADQDDVMAPVPGQDGEALDLRVEAEGWASDDELRVAVGELVEELLHHADGRILGVGHAEEELEDRVIEPEEAPEIVLQAVVDPLERLEDRDGRGVVREIPRPSQAEAEADRGGDRGDDGRQGDRGEEDILRSERHGRHHPRADPPLDSKSNASTERSMGLGPGIGPRSVLRGPHDGNSGPDGKYLAYWDSGLDRSSISP